MPPLCPAVEGPPGTSDHAKTSPLCPAAEGDRHDSRHLDVDSAASP
jgi:hypothetical protein